MTEIESEQADIETSSIDYSTRFAGEVGEYFLDVQKQITLDLLAGEGIKTVLDVGGGHAQLAVPLVNAGYEVTVTGSDVSCRHFLDKYLARDQFTFHECNFLQLPFADNSFDAVLAFRLLTHEKNWKRLVKEMCRVSRAVVIIDYPDKRSFNTLYDLLFKFKKKYEKNTRTFMLFSRQEIKDEFRQNGYNRFTLKPQFFLPMVIHRFIGRAAISGIIEKLFKVTGLQYIFGSPVIIKIKQ
jgi:ubiquinone/menaquinone biosynthesis C-methylase UbiE